MVNKSEGLPTAFLRVASAKGVIGDGKAPRGHLIGVVGNLLRVSYLESCTRPSCLVRGIGNDAFRESPRSLLRPKHTTCSVQSSESQLRSVPSSRSRDRRRRSMERPAGSAAPRRCSSRTSGRSRGRPGGNKCQRSAPRPLRTRRERVDGVLRRPSLIRPRRAPAGSVHAVNRTSVSGQAHPSTS